MTGYRVSKERNVTVTDLPERCPDGTPNSIGRMTIIVGYADMPEEGSRHAKAIVLDNIIMPRIVEGLTDKPKVLVLSLRSVAYCLKVQNIDRKAAFVIMSHMIQTEEQQQHPAHGYDREVGERYERLYQVDLPLILDAVYGVPT